MSGDTHGKFVKQWQHNSGRKTAENRKDGDKIKMKLHRIGFHVEIEFSQFSIFQRFLTKIYKRVALHLLARLFSAHILFAWQLGD